MKKTSLLFLVFAIMSLSVTGIQKKNINKKIANDTISIFETSLKQTTKQLMPKDSLARIGKLPNGMTYYIRHTEKPIGQGFFYLVQKTGSLVEKDNERGMAHFVEHLLFQGTEHFPGNSIIDYTRNIGVPFGSDLNAFTGEESTWFILPRIPIYEAASNNGLAKTVNERRIDSCLLILSDWSHSAIISDKSVDNERNVVIEEARMRNTTPYNSFLQKTKTQLLDGTVYSFQDPLGDMDMIRHCTPQQVREFYHRWFQPQLQAVIAVGDFDEDLMEKKIRRIFSDIPAGKSVIPAVSQLPVHQKPRVIVNADKCLSYAILSLIIKLPRYTPEYMQSIAYYGDKMLDDKVSCEMRNRMEELKKQHSEISNINVQCNPTYLGTNMARSLLIEVATEPKQWKTTLSLVIKEMERAHRFGLDNLSATASFPVDTLKLMQKKSAIFDRHNTTDNEFVSKREAGDYVNEYMNHFLSIQPCYDRTRDNMLCEYWDECIYREDCDQRFRQWDQDSNLVMMVNLPEDKNLKIPTEEEVMQINKEARRADLQPYVRPKEAYTDSTFTLDINPSPGQLISRKKLKIDGSTELCLQNGVTVVLHPTEKGHSQIKGFRPGGYSQFEDSDMLDAMAISHAIKDYGHYSEKDLNKLKTWGAILLDCQSYTDIIQGFGDVTASGTALPISYLRLTSTEPDMNRFETFVKENKLTSQNSNPLATFFDSVQATAAKSSQGLPKIDAGNIHKVNFNHVCELNKEYRSNFNGMVLCLQGPFDVDSMIAPVLKYIGSLPSKPKPIAVKPKQWSETKDHNDSIIHHIDMAQPLALVQLRYHQKRHFDFNVHNYYHHEVLKNVLQEILTNRIRLQSHEVYDITVSDVMENKPGSSQQYNIIFTCAPDKWRKIVNDIQQELQEIAKGGVITQQMIDDYKNLRNKQQMEKSDETDGNWAERMIQYYQNDGVIIIDHEQEELGRVTPASLRKFTRRLIDNCQTFKTVFTTSD